MKHSMECEYPTATARFGQGTRSSLNGVQPSIGSPGSVDQDGSILNLADLELLYNFTTQTCYTLHSDPVQKTMWRVNVPGLGVAHDFVMRGILALSALHLAYQHPERRDFYLNQGIVHHQLSLQRVSTILPNVNTENCSALYVFSALAGLFALASPLKPEDFIVVGEAGIADWAVMLRGTKSIIDSAEPALHEGPLGPMFKAGFRRAQLRNMPLDNSTDEGIQLMALQKLIEQSEPDKVKLEIYLAALEELRRSFTVLTHKNFGFETSDVFIWVFRVSEEFLLLLRAQSQPSLCIFAHFCLILQQLDSKWWGEGRSHHLMSQIYHLLDEEHRWWIRWPMEMMNWAPSP